MSKQLDKLDQPYLCPKCLGETVVDRYVCIRGEDIAKADPRTCPTCLGAGVVWAPIREEAHAKGSHFDPPMRKTF